jgi:chromosome segregation ATPase
MATADASNPHGFTVARHGYDREQVRHHVGNLENNLRLLTSDRDAARAELAKVTRDLNALRAQLADTTQPVMPGKEVHEQLRVMLEVTRKEAAAITAQAQSAAEQAFSAAQKAAAALRSRYEFLVSDLEAQQVQMQAEHAAAMDQLRAQLEQMSSDAETRRRRFGEEADAQHLQVEQEFTSAMTARQAALDQEVASRRETSEKEAARLIREATADAQRRTAEADEKVNQLTTLRQRVSERLRETGQLLTQSSTLLEPLDTEADVISGKKQA